MAEMINVKAAGRPHLTKYVTLLIAQDSTVCSFDLDAGEGEMLSTKRTMHLSINSHICVFDCFDWYDDQPGNSTSNPLYSLSFYLINFTWELINFPSKKINLLINMYILPPSDKKTKRALMSKDIIIRIADLAVDASFASRSYNMTLFPVDPCCIDLEQFYDSFPNWR